MTIYWEAVEQHFAVCFFNFTQFVKFGKFNVFGLGTVSFSKRAHVNSPGTREKRRSIHFK